MDSDLQRLDTEVTMALAGLDARSTQFAPKEQADRWTIQQIAEHLHLAVEGTARDIRKRLERGTRTASRCGLGQRAGHRVGQWLVLSLGWFPSGRKSALCAVPDGPVTLKTGDQLADRVHGSLVEFDRLGVRARKSLGLDAVAMHMALGELTMAQWNRFHLVHGEHHLKQIARIRQEWGF